MKGSARTVLGYLAAFTMGVLCTGVFVLLRDRGVPPPAPDEARPAEPAVASAPAPRNTFQPLRRPVPQPAPEFEPTRLEEARQEAIPDEPIVETVAAPIPTPLPVRSEVHAVVHRDPEPSVHAAPGEGGRISGKARLLNEPPPETPIDTDAMRAARWEKMGVRPFTRHYMVGKDRGLADVVISLRLDLTDGNWQAPHWPHQLKIEESLYAPYISAMQAEQSMEVTSRDSYQHNVRLLSRLNGEENRPIARGRSVRFKLEHPEEFVTLKCDVHPWEFAYVTVLPHPFFEVTDRNGVFVIERVPPGTYTIEARHRKAGTQLKEITVEANRNVDLTFDFEATAPALPRKRR